MDRLVSLLTSTGGLLRVRGIITIGAVFFTFYMWANGDPVSAVQIGLVSGWAGVYFGSRIAQS